MKYEVNYNRFHWFSVVNHEPLKDMDIILILQIQWAKRLISYEEIID